MVPKNASPLVLLPVILEKDEINKNTPTPVTTPHPILAYPVPSIKNAEEKIEQTLPCNSVSVDAVLPRMKRMYSILTMRKYFNGVFVQYDPKGDKGVLYWLGTNGNVTPYVNPTKNGKIAIEASALGKESCSLDVFVGRDLVRGLLNDQKHCWFTIWIKNDLLLPTHYSFRHYSTKDSHAIRSWCVEGTLDGGKTWILLREHKDDTTLTKAGQIATWSIDPSVYLEAIMKQTHCNLAASRTSPSSATPLPRVGFQAFRIVMLGPNSSGKYWNLCCSGVEFYGTIKLYKTVYSFI